ncbi:MAG: RNase adapter RapZ [Bdellovibrionales bacterium]|nr:RNase adapter RapZ [Bdellovibrionales bacterium]
MNVRSLGQHSIDHIAALLLVAGVSGAGKSSALDTLSDLGFYVIDNLPVALLPELIEFSRENPARFHRTAILLEIGSKEKVQELLSAIERLSGKECRKELLFLDCSDETIVKRYSETRRPHPAFDPHHDQTLSAAIQRERDLLFPIREQANFVLDTTELNIHELRRKIKSFVDTLSQSTGKTIRVNVVSFGFKYGVPLDCDLVVDVRFLPNPYFVDKLRDLTGHDQAVREYVLKFDQSREFLQRYADLLEFLLPQYVFEGKSYLNIGVGCTGGRHRSVVIANELYQRISGESYITSVSHRDAERYTSLQRE